MRRSKKSCAMKPREGSRHAISKFSRTVSMKIAVEEELELEEESGLGEKI